MPQTFSGELLLRLSLLAFSLLTFSSVALADIATDLQEVCQSPEVKRLTGSTGSCRIVVAPKKAEKRGLCQGTFMNSLPCAVRFLSTKDGALLNITCGTDPKNPAIDQDMMAEGSAFNVAAMIRKADGQDHVMNDKSEYTMITSQMVEVILIDTVNAGIKTTKGEINLSLQGGKVPLTNVVCK